MINGFWNYHELSTNFRITVVHGIATGYWDLPTGPVTGSTNDLLHVWGHSFTEANQTLQTLKQWTESSIPIPIHPIYCISHLYPILYPIYPWYPHDIPMISPCFRPGRWEECQLRRLRDQDIHRTDHQIRTAKGCEVTVEAEERHGLRRRFRRSSAMAQPP